MITFNISDLKCEQYLYLRACALIASYFYTARLAKESIVKVEGVKNEKVSPIKAW